MPRIVGGGRDDDVVFEAAVEVSDEDLMSCADGLHDSVLEIRLVAAHRMARVAHWADLHAPEPARRGSRRVVTGHRR